MMVLPRLYAVLDSSCFAAPDQLLHAAEELMAAGLELMQYRDKSSSAREMLEQARALARVTQEVSLRLTGTRRAIIQSDLGVAAGRKPPRLIMNDRADLCLAAEFDGVHVGQDDLSPESVRRLIGPKRWLGISTHNPEQVVEADKTSADYIAIGPVFATSSKSHPDPVVGLEGVRQSRELTRKPLVAIGGITRQNCRSVIDAGADSVAVIADLVRDPRKSAEEFLSILG